MGPVPEKVVRLLNGDDEEGEGKTCLGRKAASAETRRERHGVARGMGRRDHLLGVRA